MGKRKAYYLKTCSTCQRIFKELNVEAHFNEVQNIKEHNISEEQIEEMHTLAGSYESLFSRKAMKYRSLGLNEQELTEEDYKNWIMKEYTFLKRPVFIIDEEIFIGNSKKNVEAVKSALNV